LIHTAIDSLKEVTSVRSRRQPKSLLATEVVPSTSGARPGDCLNTNDGAVDRAAQKMAV